MKKTEINNPGVSKINWTVMVQSMLNVGAYFGAENGLIPQDAMADVLLIINTLSLALIGVFRTWFTKP